MSLGLSSPAFANGEAIPRRFTADGLDVSPPLAWEAVPAGTKAFALIVEDPDAPGGTWLHWSIYDLPGFARALPEGVPGARNLPDGSKQGRNGFGRLGWAGPAPPEGAAHRYVLTLYALKERLHLPACAGLGDLRARIEASALDRATLMGRYGRPTIK